MNRLYIKILYPALALIIIMASCSKTLDIAPVSSISGTSFFKTENDVKGFNNGMYIRLRNETSFNSFALGELRGETVAQGLAGTGGYDRYYTNTITPDILTPAITWTNYYVIINAANLLINKIPSITFVSEAAKNDYLAQAYTMRAYVYFLLTRTWGDLPLRTEPLEEVDLNTIQIAKSPQSEVFALIKADINKAVSLYSTNTFQTGRNLWSKPSANALKADIYLWTAKRMAGGTADFQTALEACNAVQSADVSLLPTFSTIFDYTNKGNKEVLMAVNYVAVEAVDNYFFNGYLPVTTSYAATADPAAKTAVGQLGGNNIWAPSALVRNQFTTDDQRRAATFIEVNNINATTGARTLYAAVINKGDGTVINGVRYFADDIILYRYADVLLMKAEAENALGQSPATEINLVRQRAYGTAYNAHIFINGTKDANDDAILKERLFELAYEGKRWFDLVRFGKAFDLVPSLQSKKGQDYLLLSPINLSVLALDSKVTQNPGY
ncbi:MAG: RagB/SusD family nutrient uptake outer membrane protein [Sphingobacteriaceae bacterium]|nr:MAG: RagB/SusD family nutrient uptake outer membrane protein [Sphingobacteriaceae bacterium]